MSRAIKFSILLQHEETGRIVNRIFSYADLFKGTAKDEISKLKGHTVIAKRQYIGLLDKQGEEVYEGDILRIEDISLFKPQDIGKVIWATGEACWCIQSSSWRVYFGQPETIEIIGNRYENPDLLKDK